MQWAAVRMCDSSRIVPPQKMKLEPFLTNPACHGMECFFAYLPPTILSAGPPISPQLRVLGGSPTLRLQFPHIFTHLFRATFSSLQSNGSRIWLSKSKLGKIDFPEQSLSSSGHSLPIHNNIIEKVVSMMELLPNNRLTNIASFHATLGKPWPFTSIWNQWNNLVAIVASIDVLAPHKGPLVGCSSSWSYSWKSFVERFCTTAIECYKSSYED